jgi:hypothetical protein
MHTDSLGYGWGAVLNNQKVARGFSSECGDAQHIAWKELKAVRLSLKMFLPKLACMSVLLHEDNHAVCYILAGLTTSCSPSRMTNLRKLWHMLDENGINIRAHYIRSAANVWADRLNRYLLDTDDWQLDPVPFVELNSRFGPQSIDSFASTLNRLLPGYNAGWLDPSCIHAKRSTRYTSQIHSGRPRTKSAPPPWTLLPNLVLKLRESTATATIVAPRWTCKVWHHALTDMAVEEIVISPRDNLFRAMRGMLRKPRWPVIVFRVPYPHGPTFSEKRSTPR